jgi:hypothetical protein
MLDGMQPETRYAKSGDVHVAYQVFGSGAVDLVIVPGFIYNVEHYWLDPSHARLLKRLARFARVISFDKRGTGLSDRVSTMPGMDQRMDDVRAVMDAAGSRSAALRVSEGGSLAADRREVGAVFRLCRDGLRTLPRTVIAGYAAAFESRAGLNATARASPRPSAAPHRC